MSVVFIYMVPVMLLYEYMINIIIACGLFALGACLGSFAGATVWRLRAHQLVDDKKHKRKVEAKEYKRLKPLAEQSWLKGRSIDFDSGKQLAWYDMIPIYSWLILGGKSRYSGKPIGKSEFWLELGLGLYFLISYLAWPAGVVSWYGIVQLVLWLIAGTIFAMLFMYDAKWSLLPSYCTMALIIVGALSAVLSVVTAPDLALALVSAIAAVAILSGLYLALWYISKERWIGFGDVLLGLGLALLLGRWELAFLALFLANVIGLIVVFPGLVVKKLSYTSRVPFGPFMIIGTIIAALWGDLIILGGNQVIELLTYRLWYN